YIGDIKTVLLSGNYGIVAAQEGYLLLKRGLAAPAVSASSVVKPGAGVNNAQILFDLPAEFCSFIYASPQEQIKNPVTATFTSPGGKLNLVGFEVLAPTVFSHSSGYMS